MCIFLCWISNEQNFKMYLAIPNRVHRSWNTGLYNTAFYCCIKNASFEFYVGSILYYWMFFLVNIMLKYVNENPSIHNNRIKYLGLKFLQVVKRDKNLLHSTFAIDLNLLGVDLFVQKLIKDCNSFVKKKILFD